MPIFNFWKTYPTNSCKWRPEVLIYVHPVCLWLNPLLRLVTNETNNHTPTKKPPETGGWENGAGDEIRTHDIHLGKVALYH